MEGMLKGFVAFALMVALAVSGVVASQGVDLHALWPFSSSSGEFPVSMAAPAPARRNPYPALLEQAQEHPGQADYTALRMAYVETPGYAASAMASPAAHQEIIHALQKGDWNSVIVRADRLLAADWTDVRAHMAAADAAAMTGDEFGMDLHSAAATGLLRSIVRQSDGHSPGDAYKVIDLSEEYAVLDCLSLSIDKQSLVHDNGHTYQRIETLDPAGERTVLFFNVDWPAEAEARLLRTPGSGPQPTAASTARPVALPRLSYAQAAASVARDPAAADYVSLREGYAASSSYDPVQLAASEDDMLNALAAGDGETAADRAQTILALDPADIYAHRVLLSVAKSHNDTVEADRQRQMAFGLMRAILVMGDGKAPATAWPLLSATEIASVLASRHLSAVSGQAVTSAGHAYQQEDVTDAQGNAGQVWFNLDRPVRWMMSHRAATLTVSSRP